MVLESCEGQREAGSAGQAADQTQRKGKQSTDILSDGSNVGPFG